MEIQLRDIPEKPLGFYILVALLIHVILIALVFGFLNSTRGKDLISRMTSNSKTDPNTKITLPTETEKIIDNSSTESELIPSFQPSAIIPSNINERTFVHESSGLLFADELKMPSEEKPIVAERKLIEPMIDMNFSIDSIPRKYRTREWSLTLRVRVNAKGESVGNIKVIKSSGDKTFDQLVINRVKQAKFQPAHYEGSMDYIDYTYDLKINYR